MGLLKPDNLEDIARIQVCENFGVNPGNNLKNFWSMRISEDSGWKNCELSFHMFEIFKKEF